MMIQVKWLVRHGWLGTVKAPERDQATTIPARADGTAGCPASRRGLCRARTGLRARSGNRS
ncbi:hypothetical protein GCM10009551_005850 [Nocardiopsis tropica]